MSQGPSQPSSRRDLQLGEAKLAVLPGAQECHVLATGERPGSWRHTSFPVLSFLPLLSPLCFSQNALTAQDARSCGALAENLRPRTPIYLSGRASIAAVWAGVLDPKERAQVEAQLSPPAAWTESCGPGRRTYKKLS